MEIIPFSKEHIPQAAALFADHYHKQRGQVTVLPGTMAAPASVTSTLDGFFSKNSGIAAIDGDRLVGFMGWFLNDNFRGTSRKGAYVPEWGHAVVESNSDDIYRTIYRAASTAWTKESCLVHAITLLAYDSAAVQTWFWNGFGMVVIDATRPMIPLEGSWNTPLLIRKAVPSEAEALVEIDREHCRHYTRPPVLMASPKPYDIRQFQSFIELERNSVWTAWDGSTLAGFIRFSGYEFDGVAVVQSENAVCINGAYVKPAYRGQKVGKALLNAALCDYASRDFAYCAVNFESFNPEAATFWMRYFDPVCFSLMRMPEVPIMDR